DPSRLRQPAGPPGSRHRGSRGPDHRTRRSERRRQVRGIFPGLTVEENLAVRLQPAERAKAYERFEQLASRRPVVAGHLSGGEQQILALAPLLIRPPRLLVADEPTLGLAP